MQNKCRRHNFAVMGAPGQHVYIVIKCIFNWPQKGASALLKLNQTGTSRTVWVSLLIFRDWTTQVYFPGKVNNIRFLPGDYRTLQLDSCQWNPQRFHTGLVLKSRKGHLVQSPWLGKLHISICITFGRHFYLKWLTMYTFYPFMHPLGIKHMTLELHESYSTVWATIQNSKEVTFHFTVLRGEENNLKEGPKSYLEIRT